jgi:hypothetical protein
VYYAGHGLLDADDLKKLYLATADTIIKIKKATCISSDEIKEPLLKCKAKNKVMILDCCYAGRMAGLQSDTESIRLSHWGETKGVYFMMSSDRDVPSRFDPNDDTIPTFFTQKLIDTIRDGADVDQEIWTLDAFFEIMKQGWNKEIAPIPLKLTFDDIGNFPFCYNRFRFIKKGDNDEERLLNDIEADPTDEKLADFINNCKSPDLRRRANAFWNKMKKDFELLTKALNKKSFDVLSKFIDEVDPVKPVRKIATEKMTIMSIENRNRSINQAIGSKARSKEKFRGATSNPVKPRKK